jgi:hypothetical protein
MNHVPKSLWTSTFAAAMFSSDILQSLCFLGFAVGLTCSLCSIMSLLTPIRSEVLHTNTSLFLSKNDNNSVSLFGVRSWEIIAVLSSTLGSNGTLLVSHYGSIDLLADLSPFSFLVLLPLLSTLSPYKQFTFLWPEAKSCSMFLASFWLPWTKITPRVAGTFRQR